MRSYSLSEFFSSKLDKARAGSLSSHDFSVVDNKLYEGETDSHSASLIENNKETLMTNEVITESKSNTKQFTYYDFLLVPQFPRNLFSSKLTSRG